jgi:hypothetical protein
MKFWGLPLLKGRDRLYEGRGNMHIELLPFVTIADASGEEIDQGTLLRYLNEMMWFPTAYVSDYVTWEAIDDVSARVSIATDKLSVSAVLCFNEIGQIVNFVAERYMSVDGGFRLETWSTPVGEYERIDGLMVPTKGEGVWKLSSGDFSYVKLRLTEVQYNLPGSC